MKKLLVLFLTLSMVFCLVPVVQADAQDPIAILFENDVHCALDGYGKLAALKQDLLDDGFQVGVVSAGDFIQGSSLGAISQGEYVVNTMNLVGYDAIALGNHEFDYKLPRLLELTEKMNCKPTCCNFMEIGKSESVFQPYSMVSYGEVDIAYIGVTTPDTLTSSSPAQFLNEKGEYRYTFNGTDLYNTVQNTIDAAKADGAEYIVALAHLGTENVHEQWSSPALVQNTHGLDVVLDGHSHSVVEGQTILDGGGEEVVIASVGTKFQYVGQLTIENQEITTKLIPMDSYEKQDPAVMAYLAQINEEYAQLGNRKIGISMVDLTTVDEDGNRIIRHTETNLGDFCADAYRTVLGADIGVQNGGGIRADMAAGEVTFNDILSVFPFNNTACVVEVSGQQIIDLLELGVMHYPEEDGTFQHVSGLTFQLDRSVSSPVVLDENMVFVGVDGKRRVTNVKVWDKNTETYQPIDLEKQYTVASHNYLLLDQGGGASMFKNAKVIRNDGILDVEVLELYITQYLKGVIGEQYACSQNRIEVIDGSVKTDDETVTDTNTKPSIEGNGTSSQAGEEDTAIPETGEFEVLWLPVVLFVAAGLFLLLNKKEIE